jgi:hypothetical protein
MTQRLNPELASHPGSFFSNDPMNRYSTGTYIWTSRMVSMYA